MKTQIIERPTKNLRREMGGVRLTTRSPLPDGPGCRCDRWGHPCPNCTKVNPTLRERGEKGWNT